MSHYNRPPACVLPDEGTLVRLSFDASLVDLLERLIDKGIVIDFTTRISRSGIDLRAVHSQILVTAVIYLEYAEVIHGLEIPELTQ